VMSNIVGFYSQGLLVTRQRIITMHYLKTWFILDILVVCPDWFDRLTTDSGDGESDTLSQAGRALRSVRALRTLRLLRLLKLQRIQAIVYDTIDSEYAFIGLTIARLI
ncbi:unnamed protein product, partial [Polarella glacialis]